MSGWIPRIMRHISTGIAGAAQDMSKSYEEAVRALNTLQSNAAVLEKTKRERDQNRHLNVPATIGFAARTGLSRVHEHQKQPPGLIAVDEGAEQYNQHLNLYMTNPHFRLDELDKLSVIHISGTKGKGSTCAFCERVLRQHGYKTGFYSSPHLVEVRERIRINGQPISQDAFSTYFWDCFTKLESTKEAHGGAMPAYFRFLTIMAFHVFLQEQVDVAIIEVGIGGSYDCTNILRSPVVCGVTSLDFDHCGVLGDTIDKIAWQKAGIMKPGVPAVTVQQPGNSLQVLVDRAREIGAPLQLTPSLDSYAWGSHPVELGIPGVMQRVNASLALQLTSIWLRDHHKSIEDRKEEHLSRVTATEAIQLGEHFVVDDTMAEGLRCTEWPGRGQRIERPGVTYYLDGAHTPSSIENCIEWYNRVSKEEDSARGGKVARVLLFNSTGDRKPKDLLQLIAKDCEFDLAVFCPNIATSTNSADQTNYMVTSESQYARVLSNRHTWIDLLQNTANTDTVLPPGEEHQNNAPCDVINEQGDGDHMANDTSYPAYTFRSIEDALSWLSHGQDPLVTHTGSITMSAVLPEKLADAEHVQVFCTGSLHLVGGILRLISPALNDPH